MTFDKHHAKPHWRPPSASLQFRALLYLLMLDCLVIIAGFFIASAIFYSASSDTGWVAYVCLLVPLYALIASNIQAYSASDLFDPTV